MCGREEVVREINREREREKGGVYVDESFVNKEHKSFLIYFLTVSSKIKSKMQI